ncbi:hypothetical protein A2818_01510 [Candidatus Nomurabacteria bacterium RIFCSPHIGHO2_01_FULL_40_12]|uniref:Uncharacterized protein n=1 Tax=Candidatus Nomurabacteria bacterium RIFCSPHIGHO2_01_FULL_40_12 TaxID=1801737 RepID=A0A1F6V1N1_9BACT|nr:MAG: hypothetical protein A2818_01510 [Candidatus Nomurabacteria bacterium RIFCSPHIGHO2_01_FULL_40_12]
MLAAVLASVFMAVVMCNDRIFLSAGDEPVLSDPMQLLVVSSFLPAFSLVWALSGGLPSIPTIYVLGAFLAGTLWTISNAAFFAATKITTDFDEVATWDASSPGFIALIGIPFGITLIPRYWVGIAIMAGSLLALRYAFKGRAQVENKTLYYGLLVLHVGALTGTMFGFDFLLKWLGEGHYSSLYVSYLGGQAVGFLALLWPSVRRNFVADAPKIRRFWPALVLGEVSYVISLTMMTWAMKGYPGAVVMALQGTYPLIIMGFGELIRRIEFFRRFGDMQVAFPPQEGERWKKLTILIANVFAHGLLTPQTTPKLRHG